MPLSVPALARVRGRVRRRVAVQAAVVLAAVLAVSVAASYAVCFRPVVDRPGTADAVVVLGGDVAVRLPAGLALVRSGVARDLVVSVPPGSADPLTLRLCRAPAPRVHCFTPSPATTRGEARRIGLLAAENGWSRIVVVTTTFHVSRARMLVARCYDGELRMVAAPRGDPPPWWEDHFGYETAAFTKAAVLRGC